MLRRISHTPLPQHTIPNNPFQADLKFKPGEILKGTVIRKFPGGELLVSAEGKQFRAYTALNLIEGDRQYFQVKTLGPGLS